MEETPNHAHTHTHWSALLSSDAGNLTQIVAVESEGFTQYYTGSVKIFWFLERKLESFWSKGTKFKHKEQYDSCSFTFDIKFN